MFATIDIGTNSILLLIAEVMPNGSVRAVVERIVITRLGRGLVDTGMISEESSRATIAGLRSFLKTCRENDVEEIVVVGTSVLRNARNANKFISEVKSELDLHVDILTEIEEATLTFEASAHDFGENIVVIDIGGGSTEFIFGSPMRGPTPLSIPIGSVSLTEKHLPHDPVRSDEVRSLRDEIEEILEVSLDIESLPVAPTVVATAGTATTLMAMEYEVEPYDSRLVHGKRLGRDSLKQIVGSLSAKTIEERKRIAGLMPERADVILAGAVLLEEAMKFLECNEVLISDRGVRWGVFYREFLNRS